jgi:plasmid stabilization system protein ParE
MRSGYKIEWSIRATRDLDKILEYLIAEWGEKSFKDFAKSLDRRLNLIALRPTLYSKVHFSKPTRKSVLGKRITIYYRITNKKVFLITLFDNRQDPNRAPK